MIYLLLFWEFFKIGLFTFGGGFAMIPLIKDTVVSHGWLSIDEFTNFIGICESTPGPIAVNMATYVGSTQGGILGSICATVGVILPSVIIIILIAAILNNFTKNKYFKGFLKGVKPVIIALILSTGLILLAETIGFTLFESFTLYIPSIICFSLITIIYFIETKLIKRKVSSIKIIGLSILLGFCISLLY